MADEKIKNTIRKLLNLANDSGAFEGEIDNALRFARRLMLQHNVTEDDLKQPKDPHEIAAATEYAQVNAYSHGENFSMWESILMNALCALIGTIKHYRTAEKVKRRTPQGTIVFDENGDTSTATRVVFYGPAEDARDASVLFSEWTHIIATMARMKWGGCFRGDGRSYAEGFAHGLLRKVKEIQSEERQEITAGTSGALVLVRATDVMLAKQQRADSWLEKDMGIKLGGTPRRANIQNEVAWAEGMNDGKRADFEHKRNLKLEG